MDANMCCEQGLYLFPHYPNHYILLLTSGKTFSNLPEHTWVDYNKMAPALPPLVQSAAPIPCMPQSRQQPQPRPIQPQPPQQFQMQPQYVVTGCCPIGTTAPHNCCAPAPQVSRPFGIGPLPTPYVVPVQTRFHSWNQNQAGGYPGGQMGGQGFR